MTLTGTLADGLEVAVTAKRTDAGLEVTLGAEPSDLTRAHDLRFEAELTDYLAAAERGEHAERAFPDTGAETLMRGLELRHADGRMAPHSVTGAFGGSETPWRVVFRSPDWQPAEVLIVGEGIALHVPVEG